MEEKKNTTKRKTSSVKSRKKIEKTTLSNEELLEQILNKKKKKVSQPKVEKVEIKDKNQQSVADRIKEINEKLKDKTLSSDEIYELISEKKKLSKKGKTTPKVEVVEEKPKVVEKQKEVIPEKPKVPEKELELTQGVILDKEKQPKEEKKKSVVPWLIIVSLILGIIIGSLVFLKLDKKAIFKPKEDTPQEEIKDDKFDEQLKEFQTCLNREFSVEDKTQELLDAEKELTKYLGKYRTSVGYKDVKTGYTYKYSDNVTYYAASSIKALSVLYLYTEAAEGNIDLDSTMTYTARYKWAASKEMSKIKLNSEVKLRDLAKYAITVSDNTAYQMLVDYIGRAKLREFGKSLGAKKTLSGGDNFGNIDVADGLAYWEAIYEFIKNNGELGQEFRSYLVSAEQNDLAIADKGIEAAHKYGEYNPYYNDLGIVYSSNPYFAVILTREYGKNMENVIKDINSHLYELHLKFYENRNNICRIEVYGE